MILYVVQKQNGELLRKAFTKPGDAKTSARGIGGIVLELGAVVVKRHIPLDPPSYANNFVGKWKEEPVHEISK